MVAPESQVRSFALPVSLLLGGLVLATVALATLFSGSFDAVDAAEPSVRTVAARPWLAAVIGIVGVGALWLGLLALRGASVRALASRALVIGAVAFVIAGVALVVLPA